MEQYVYTYDSFAQRGAEQYVPTERFQVKSSVYLPASDIDLRTGRLQPDRQRRRRTQALMLEKERLDAEDQTLSESLRREYSKSGVRISVRALVLIVAAVLFFCGILLLSQQGMIAERQKAINRLERSIKDYRAQNASLEEEFAGLRRVHHLLRCGPRPEHDPRRSGGSRLSGGCGHPPRRRDRFR